MASVSLFAERIELWYETFGEKHNPALLLLMGGCCQGIIWDQDFCERLAQEGFYVIRYDHRDTGLSTYVDYDKDPYDLLDLTKDAVSILDAAGVAKAHLFGVSMGAMLSEMMAVYYPERVKTITLLGSTCDIRPMNVAYEGKEPEKNALCCPPSSHYLAWMKEYMQFPPRTEEEKLAHRVEGWERLNGYVRPLEKEKNRKVQAEFLSRQKNLSSVLNHIRMLNTTATEEYVRTVPAQVRVPTVILHGSEDPIFPPNHGEALSRAIPHADYIPVAGMGHIPNPYFYDLYVDVLKRQSSKVPHRPQEPVAPLPYEEEEVSFTNAADGVALSGTLTLPRGEGPFPAVVLLHGSAPFDRNSSNLGHKPFLVWADMLTRKGIAVLRFDKRSAGKSTGEYASSTQEDFARDALAGVEYLRSRSAIEKERIGLVGHSEGGMTASIAASMSKDIAFLVLMASPCVSWEELVPAQSARFQRADGVDEATIQKSLDLCSQVFAVLKNEQNREAAAIALRDLYEDAFSKLDASERATIERYYGQIEQQIVFFNAAWFRYAFAFDIVPVLKRLSIPVLAMNGEKDLVVDYEQNLLRIESACKDMPGSLFLTFPDLNHAFQRCKIGSLQEYMQLEETVAPFVMDKVAEWILI